MSSLEPLPPHPVFSREVRRDNSILIIVLITIVVLVIVAAIIVYAIFRSRDTILINRCEPDLCVVNLTTGVKRCPTTAGEQLVYDKIFEDCTSGNYCQSDRAPCAVLAGGTLNCDGVCGIGNTRCNCQKAPI